MRMCVHVCLFAHGLHSLLCDGCCVGGVFALVAQAGCSGPYEGIYVCVCVVAVLPETLADVRESHRWSSFPARVPKTL